LTQIVILIKNLCTLSDRKVLIFPVTYFLTNQIYPFTVRETGIQINNLNHQEIKNVFKKAPSDDQEKGFHLYIKTDHIFFKADTLRGFELLRRVREKLENKCFKNE